MNRSEINNLIKSALKFFDEFKWKLPPFAYYTLNDWKKIASNQVLKQQHSEIIQKKLGWDLTDFGSGNFEKIGLLLFTIRNGEMDTIRTYAEKIMIQKNGQSTPLHYHWKKCEDIINRGGGDLVIKVYKADPRDNYSKDGEWQSGILSDSKLELLISGKKISLDAGIEIILKPGEDIVIPPRIYHSFLAEKDVFIGEISMVNDDTKDNRFYENIPRFSKIENDTQPEFLLVSDYENILNL